MEKQRTLLTKNLIKESLLDLLKYKKLHEISIKEICKKASINRATFYNYYDSIESAFVEIENSFIKAVTSELNINVQSSQLMFECMNKGLIFLKENKEAAKAVFNNIVSPDFPLRLLAIPNVYNAIKLTTDVIISEHLRNYYSTFLITGNFSLLKMWINEGCEVDTKEIAALMISIGNRNNLKEDYISMNIDASSKDKDSSKNLDK